MFDLIIYQLSITAGREQHELPGLLVTNAPRKAARMRTQDHLILYLRLLTSGGGTGVPGGTGSPVAFTTAQQQEMLRRLAETYFTFSGSVTAGLKAVAGRMNDYLLSRNLKSADGGRTVGILNMAVMHGSTVMIGHAGPTHTFVLGREAVQHFDDSLVQGGSNLAGRGLGLSRVITPRFHQADLLPGDLLIVVPEPPGAWTARALTASPQLSFDHLRRRLLSGTGVELQAAVIRCQAGKGVISYWKPGTRAQVPQEVAAASEALAGAGQEVPGQKVAAAGASPAGAARQEVVEAATELAPTESVEEIPAASSILAQSQPNTTETIFEPGDLAQEHLAAETPALERWGADVAAADAAPADAPAPADSAPAADAPQVIQPAPLHARRAEASASPRPAVTSRPDRRGGTAARAGGQAAQGAVQRPIRAAKPKTPRQPIQIRLPFGGLRRRMALGQRAGALWQRSAPVRMRAGGAIASAARKAIPQRRDSTGAPMPLFNLDRGTMLATAVVIPLIVVAVATAVYFQAGRGEQYDAVFLQAQQYAQQAQTIEDPAQQRESWERAFELVGHAEQYRRTDQSRALRKQAQDALDAIEGFTRLNFTPALRAGVFTDDVRITRIVATLNDVYLLDSAQGRILRLYRTGTGYDIDPNFLCGPGRAGTVMVGPLVDLAALSPTNDFRAQVMGVDVDGNLVYCSASREGFDSRPLTLPDTGWGGVTGITLYGEQLYVLDPKTNAVYYYDGSGGVFDGPPRLYFGEKIPKMDDVVDIAVDQEFLYLLHADGQMTICEGGGYSLAETECNDTPYGDSRPGHEPSPLRFDGAAFTQIQTTQPPDPSLFALDEANRSVYHLSLRRLNLQRQYLEQTVTDFPLPDSGPTAFAVSPNRRVLLAFDSQVYFAILP